MRQTVPCSQCGQKAVAELFNQALCPGCLMRILSCEDGEVPVRRLDSVPAKRSQEKSERARML